MPTIEESFRMMLTFGMSSLRPDVEKMGEEGLTTEEMLRKTWLKCIKDEVFWFGCDPDDNIRFQTGMSAVYAWALKNRPEDAERIHAEFQAIKAFADACRSTLPLHVDDIVDKLKGHKPFGMRGIWDDACREVRVLPVLEQGERELEGR